MTKFILILISLIISNAAFSNTLTSKQQLEQAIQAHKGDVIYIDFWASWCGPCRKSFPWLNKIQSKYKDQGFVVISVNLDANRELAEKFLKETPADFAVIYDPKGKTAKHFKIKGMPSSILIDKNGNIKASHAGFFTKKISQYEKEISTLVSGK
ncbi:MAG: TlpA family protein disulfide reductase [Alteromonadaceae bacterium]|nr:TlpA family protein disulfide reductase [Alteromonadaceae bacterium]